MLANSLSIKSLEVIPSTCLEKKKIVELTKTFIMVTSGGVLLAFYLMKFYLQKIHLSYFNVMISNVMGNV